MDNYIFEDAQQGWFESTTWPGNPVQASGQQTKPCSGQGILARVASQTVEVPWANGPRSRYTRYTGTVQYLGIPRKTYFYLFLGIFGVFLIKY